MSGTSLDGIDGVLADFSGSHCVVTHHASAPFAPELRAELMALNTSGTDELHRAALAGNALSRAYAQIVQTLLKRSGQPASSIRAIGAHGQTVRHRPQEFDGTGYTLQLGNPALLAERTGITSLSVLGADGSVLVFDCGPGNALMDYWCQRHTGQAFDAGGACAASGKVLPELLASLLDEPFLRKPPPKSTGRDLFNPAWLAHHLAPFAQANPADVQATLTEYTARACAIGANSYKKNSKTMAVCGGGALNAYLMSRLQAACPGVQVTATDTLGLPALQVEAAAFAWLARQALHGRPGNLASVTGAAGARVLGAVYPA